MILGLIFFIVRYPKLKRINKDELSRLILDTSQAKVESMIDEPDSDKEASTKQSEIKVVMYLIFYWVQYF